MIKTSFYMTFYFKKAKNIIFNIVFLFFFAVKLPPLFDLIFKNKERQFDQTRWSLCEWILDLDEGFMKKMSDSKKPQFIAVILTLKYLVQVLILRLLKLLYIFLNNFIYKIL